MTKTVPGRREPAEIGRRARVIRCHRGLSVDLLATVAGIQVALHNYGPDDVPDVRVRPLAELVA